MTTYYDPATPPKGEEWLSIDTHERVRLVKNYLLTIKPKAASVKMRALFIAAAETLIAQGSRPAREAVTRLLAEGVPRPEAIEAVADVLAANPLFSLSRPNEASARDRQLTLNAALRRLPARSMNGDR